jgi:Mg-chelatase subunit ChlD
MAVPFTPPSPPGASKKAFLEKATKAKATESSALATNKSLIKPEDAKDRLRIIFDNSGSMHREGIAKAKDGVVEFLRYCTLNQTAVAIHLLDEDADFYANETQIPANIITHYLNPDLITVASEIKSPAIGPTGMTPFFKVTLEALKATPKATRIVAFSDGSPNDRDDMESTCAYAREAKIPIDTVYINPSESKVDEDAIFVLRQTAELSGGIFLDLTKLGIKEGFKYLAPTKRLMLSDASFKAKIEAGKE